MSAASRSRARSRTRARAALLTAGATAAVLTLASCSSGGTSGGGGNTNFVTGNNGIDTVAAGHRGAAPELSGDTIAGKRLDIADYRGDVVVINIWGSWCSPCRAEAKYFAKVSRAYEGKGVQFVGINTRDTSTRAALNFEEDAGITYPSLYDPTGKLLLRFKKGTLNPQLIPSTIVIDKKGKLAARALQALDEEALRDMVEPVLAEK
jgi:thiol-disulfide isomerase/thioredoxin